MYKLRLKFYKKEDMVFISHLDLIRLFERAFRRAYIPISYTKGYNPRPIMAFATALGIGVSSDGEYMDIEIQNKIELHELINNLNNVLPDGIAIVEGRYIDKSQSSLMSIINYSKYETKIVFYEDKEEKIVKNKLKTFLNLEEIIDIKEKKRKGKYKRPNKNALQEINIRDYIKGIDLVKIKGNEAILNMILATGSNGNLKPEVVVDKIKEYVNLGIDTEKTRVHRLELYTQITPQYLTPLNITSLMK